MGNNFGVKCPLLQIYTMINNSINDIEEYCLTKDVLLANYLSVTESYEKPSR